MRPGLLRKQVVLATIVTFALAIALRWDVISISVRLNPDEGELMAAGRRAAMQLWMPMSTASANTYFPLWPSFLGALDALGVPMTMRSAHVLSALLVAATLSLLWVGTARRWGWGSTAVLLAPGAWALLANMTDFKHLSTELPSVLLLVLSARIVFVHDKVIGHRRLALAVAVASLAPWFKPQSGPLAVAVVLAACVFAHLSRQRAWDGREWRRRALYLALGGVGPSAFLVTLMLLGGTFQEFWQEPVGFLLAYLTGNVSGLGVGSQSASIGTKTSVLAIYVLSQFFVLMWAAVGARGVWVMHGDSTRRRLAGLVVVVLPLAATLLTLLVQWPIYPHYLLFLYAGTAVAALAGSGLPSGQSSTGRDSLLVPLFKDAVALKLVLGTVLGTLGLLTVIKPGDDVERHLPPDPAVSTLCGPGTSVFIWGWVPELYAYYDWQPASRYVNYGLLRAETPHQEDYRARFSDEMQTTPPECVVSATGEGWFRTAGTDIADLERDLPSIQPMLRQCYQRHDIDAGAETALVVWKRLVTC